MSERQILMGTARMAIHHRPGTAARHKTFWIPDYREIMYAVEPGVTEIKSTVLLLSHFY